MYVLLLLLASFYLIFRKKYVGGFQNLKKIHTLQKNIGKLTWFNLEIGTIHRMPQFREQKIDTCWNWKWFFYKGSWPKFPAGLLPEGKFPRLQPLLCLTMNHTSLDRWLDSKVFLMLQYFLPIVSPEFCREKRKGYNFQKV